MKKLGKRNYELIGAGVETHGTYDPDEIFYIFEESLYVGQMEIIYDFLKWCHTKDKPFGSGNYEARFQEFLKDK